MRTCTGRIIGWASPTGITNLSASKPVLNIQYSIFQSRCPTFAANGTCMFRSSCRVIFFHRKDSTHPPLTVKPMTKMISLTMANGKLKASRSQIRRSEARSYRARTTAREHPFFVLWWRKRVKNPETCGRFAPAPSKIAKTCCCGGATPAINWYKFT
jgi:hypothetical protein